MTKRVVSMREHGAGESDGISVSGRRDLQDTHSKSVLKQSRQCVGCRKRDERHRMMRVVLGPMGGVAVDLANHAQGRGAHVHCKLACLQLAVAGGFSKSFRVRVRCELPDLLQQIGNAAARRMSGLLRAANLSGSLVFGKQALQDALVHQHADLVLMARDVDGQLKLKGLQEAIDLGQVVLWGTKQELGAALGRGGLAVVGVCSPKFAQAIGSLCRMLDALGICSGGVVSSEVR